MQTRTGVTRFVTSEHGGFSVEVLPWIMSMGVLMTLIFDTAMSYQNYNHVLRSVQDTNRLVSIGAIRDPQRAQEFAEFNIEQIYPDAVAQTVIDPTSGYVWTHVTVPWTALHLTGWLAVFDADGMNISAAHMLEWS